MHYADILCVYAALPLPRSLWTNIDYGVSNVCIGHWKLSTIFYFFRAIASLCRTDNDIHLLKCYTR